MSDFLEEVLAAINKSGKTLDSIELISDTSRLQPLQDRIAEKFWNNYSNGLQRTLNSQECLARGAVLRAAKLAKNADFFEYEIEETFYDSAQPITEDRIAEMQV